MDTLAQSINREASQKNIPLSVFIELTRRCNCTCYYCYQQSLQQTKELSLEQWQQVFSQLKSAGALYLTLSGGEPFVREDIFDLLKEAKKQNFAVSLISNGLLISEVVAKQLKDFTVMDVGISFHAAERDLHDRLSGMPGCFDQAKKAVTWLRQEGIKVVLKHSVSTENFGQFKALQRLATQLDCAFECDCTVLPDTPGTASNYSLTVDQYKEFLTYMGQDSAGCSVDDDQAALHCDAGRSLCGIGPNGTLYPCIILPVPLGNVTESSFMSLWEGDLANSFRKNEKSLSKECTLCALKVHCSRCHAVALLEGHSWQGKSHSLCARANALQQIGKQKK